jgi:hypothetical protein
MRVYADEIPQPKPGQVLTHVVTLKSGDTAWMPGTTKHVFHGPVQVEYKIYPDGGVDAKRLN